MISSGFLKIPRWLMNPLGFQLSLQPMIILTFLFRKECKILISFSLLSQFYLAQLAGAVECTDCTSAAPMSPGYDAKQSDGEVPVMLGL